MFPRSCQEILNINPSAPKDNQIILSPDSRRFFPFHSNSNPLIPMDQVSGTGYPGVRVPVARVSLGKIEGSGIFNLGKLKCSGSYGTPIEEPTSYRDLYQLAGHTNNGFYIVRGIMTYTNQYHRNCILLCTWRLIFSLLREGHILLLLGLQVRQC